MRIDGSSGEMAWTSAYRDEARSSAPRATASAAPAPTRTGARRAARGRSTAATPTRSTRPRGAIRDARPAARWMTVAGDIGDPGVQAALVAAARRARHPRQQQRRPAARATSASSTAAAIHAGLDANMVAPIALVQRVIDGMVERRFGRIVSITSASVKAPIAGLDLSSGARIGLTGFLAGVARAGRARQRHDQLPAARPVRDAPAATASTPSRAKAQGIDVDEAARTRARAHPREALRRPGRVRRRLRVPVLRPGRLHHRAEPADRRRRLPRRAIKPSLFACGADFPHGRAPKGTDPMAANWAPDSWTAHEARQLPDYPDAAALTAATDTLRDFSAAGLRGRGAQPDRRARARSPRARRSCSRAAIAPKASPNSIPTTSATRSASSCRWRSS